MTRMHNPPHLGEVLREYLGKVTINDAAKRLSVSRMTLQGVVSGTVRISADMAYRLAAAFGTSPDLWTGMQLRFDLNVAGKRSRPTIVRIG